MISDFLTKHPQFKGKVSYELYWKIVKKQKLPFASLGHEECETCDLIYMNIPNPILMKTAKLAKCGLSMSGW